MFADCPLCNGADPIVAASHPVPAPAAMLIAAGEDQFASSMGRLA
jgi:hypothetical protein